MVTNVKPLLLPVDYFSRQLVWDVDSIHPLLKLNTRTANHMPLFGIRLWLKMEQVAEEFEVGLDAQESFTQMYEDRNIDGGVGSKMMQRGSVVIQKTRKEIRTRKSKSAIEIRGKSNNFASIFIQMGVA